MHSQYHHPELHSLRVTSTSVSRAGYEAQASEVTSRERSSVGCMETAWRNWTVVNWERTWRKPGPARQAVLRGARGEGKDCSKSFFLPVHALRQQDTTYMSSGSGCKLNTSSWAPEVSTGHCQCYEKERKWSCSAMYDLLWPHTLACQAPPSMGFSRQEYWSGWPFPSPRDLPDPGIKPKSPALQTDSLPSEPAEKPCI